MFRVSVRRNSLVEMENLPFGTYFNHDGIMFMTVPQFVDNRTGEILNVYNFSTKCYEGMWGKKRIVYYQKIN